MYGCTKTSVVLPRSRSAQTNACKSIVLPCIPAGKPITEGSATALSRKVNESKTQKRYAASPKSQKKRRKSLTLHSTGNRYREERAAAASFVTCRVSSSCAIDAVSTAPRDNALWALETSSSRARFCSSRLATSLSLASRFSEREEDSRSRAPIRLCGCRYELGLIGHVWIGFGLDKVGLGGVARSWEGVGLGWGGIRWNAIQCSAMQRNAMQRHAVQCDVMRCEVRWCNEVGWEGKGWGWGGV